MKATIRTIILRGIILPSVILVAYGILCVATDPMGIVLTDIFVKIPIALLVMMLIMRRVRQVEKKTLPAKYTAIITAAFIIAVCVPTQLMVQGQAVEGYASGYEYLVKSILTAPVLEELVYRGIIFGVSRVTFGFWPATIVSAVLFQMTHIDPKRAIVTVPLAIATAGMYELTGNLKYSMLFHSVFNLVSCFFVDIHIPYVIALPIYIVSMALLIVAVAKRDKIANVLRFSADNRHFAI